MGNGTDIVWPDHLSTLSECAKLFEQAGRKVDRTNIGRFIDSRSFPYQTRGRSKLVDAKQLFDAYTGDFSRQVMAGESGQATSVSQPPAPQRQPPEHPSPPSTDPKRREAELKVIDRQLDLTDRLRQTIPVEETEAACADAVAELRAAFAQTVHDQADEIAVALGLPASKIALLRARLKGFAKKGQEAFANRMAEHAAALNEETSSARDRLTKLTARSLQLRKAAEQKYRDGQ